MCEKAKEKQLEEKAAAAAAVRVVVVVDGVAGHVNSAAAINSPASFCCVTREHFRTGKETQNRKLK